MIQFLELCIIFSVVLRSSLPTYVRRCITSYIEEKTVLDEPAPVSGRGVRSEQGKGGVEHGKNRAPTREGDARLRAGRAE
jgi:hypothetical protein